MTDHIPQIARLFTVAPCFICNGTKTFNMADDGEPEDIAPCPECCRAPITTKGLTYVAMGFHGGGVILDTDCGILYEEANECGSTIDSVGLDEPPDVGIWKAVVEYWGHRDYWGDYESGYNIVGDWEPVESYPEPDCVELDGSCDGMLAPRGDDDTLWACDAHAGQVS